MDAIVAWFQMGGYAGFVWSAYGVAAAILGALAFHAWRRHRSSEKALAGLQRSPNG
jgi:heme exporter protein CcmD